MTLGELAAAEQVRPPTMTRLVRALEREGLVTREDVPGDRRQVRLRATPAGRLVLDRGRRRRISALAAALRTLSESERVALAAGAEVLDRVVELIACER